MLDAVTEPGRFADLVAGYIELTVPEKQGLLETLSVEERLRRVLARRLSAIVNEPIPAPSRRVRKDPEEWRSCNLIEGATMPTTLTLAVMASLFVPVQAVRQPPTAPPQKLNAVLCKSEVQAIALARSMASGKTELALVIKSNPNHG